MKSLLFFCTGTNRCVQKKVKKISLQKCFVFILALFAMQVSFAQTKVLIVAADLPEYTADVQTKLLATGAFTSIDIFDAAAGTPSVSLLQGYNTVFVWSDLHFADPVTLGNNLAAYVDGGGGVVTAVFAATNLNIAGAFNTDTYQVIVPANQTQEPTFTLGTVEMPAHPLMQDVTSFNGGTSSYRSTSSALASGAYRVADWNDGSFLITAKNNVGQHQVNRVDLGFFPPSVDVRAGFWLPSTSGVAIMKNALLYVAGTYVCTAPASFTVTGGGTDCTGGNGLPVMLSNSQIGVSYQLQLNANNIGAPLTGNNTQLDFGNQSLPGVYTVKATSIQNNNCTAIMQGSATIDINPVPSVDPVADQTICSGSTSAVVDFSSAVAGTVFYWTSDNNTIGMLSSGTGSIPSFTAINNGATTQVATVTVTPLYTNNGVSCTGTPITFTITVNPLPAIICPADIVVNNTAGQCGAIVNFPLPAATGYPLPVVTAVPPSGSFFPTGVTTVTATATNSCGTPTCTFTVTVNDTEAPKVSFAGDITVNAPANSCEAVVSYPLPIITDNCGSTRPLSVTQSTSTEIVPANSVSCNDGFHHFENSYYRVYDLGAMALPGPFTIEKIRFGIESAVGNGGTQPATIKLYTLTGNLNLSNLSPVGSQQLVIPDQAAGLFTATLAVPVTVPANAKLVIELFTPDGTTAGNTFIIGSNYAPQTGASYIAAPVCGADEPVDIAEIGFAGMHIILGASGYVGGALVPVLTSGPASGSSFVTGNTTVTYSTVDAWGNVGSGSFTVHVKDVTPPTVVTKNISITLDASGSKTITTQDIDNGSFDACGIRAMRVSPSVFSCADKGIKNVILTITDNSGNAATGNATVNVAGGSVDIQVTDLPAVACLTDTAIALQATPAGGIWAGQGVKGNYFDPSAAGPGTFTLTYTYTGSSNCITTKYSNILVQDCSERHRQLKDAIVVYPNPVKGKFFIKFLSDNYKEINTVMFDAAGKAVKKMQFSGLAYGKILPVDVKELASGIYFLKVNSKNEAAAFKLVVVK